MRFRAIVILLSLMSNEMADGVGPVRRGYLDRERFSAALEQRTLRLVGGRGADTIIVEVIADRSLIVVEYRAVDGGQGSRSETFPLEGIERLEIDAGGGADFVNVVDPAETLDRRRIRLKLDGGDGDNIVVMSHAPFSPEAVIRLRELRSVATQLKQLAVRIDDATTTALANDAFRQVERLRGDVATEAQSIAADAEKQLLAPASELVERDVPRMNEAANTLLVRLDELVKCHEKLVADLTAKLDPTNGVDPPDDDSEPVVEPTGAEPQPEELDLNASLTKLQELEQTALALGSDAESQMGEFEAEMVRGAASIEVEADRIEERAERLAASAERIAGNAETELTASADRIVALLGELQAVNARLAEIDKVVRQEILTAIGTARTESLVALPKAGTTCNAPSTTQTYVGGSGFDFFFPISAPSDSWSIDGGDGFNILFGGLAADDIKGGSETDILFGLGGNDQIHGRSGVDVLFGEFLIDIPSLTGDDCIRGEDDVDVIAGDNGIELSSGGTAGGNDNLYGGGDVDVIFGDDISDLLSNTLPGGGDVIQGNDDVDVLIGCGGDDEIDGNDDIDAIFGYGGNDIIRGNDGRDVNIQGTTIHLGNLLLGDPGEDELHGGKGIDVMFAGADNDKMWGGEQVDFMFGLRGEDQMRGEAGGVVFRINGVDIRLGNLMLGGADDDKMWGGGDLDVMLGQNEDDEVRGFDGNFQPLGLDMDVLLGGTGDDSLEGDDESLLLLTSIDFMFGQDGKDRLLGGSNPDFLFGGGQEDTMQGDSGSLLLVASTDVMFGGSGEDTMHGGNSLDIMFGRSGNDTITGDDEAFGVISPDLIFGGTGNDVINGGSFLDVVFGNDGADQITGDSNHAWQPLSADVLFGGPGPDVMNGGNATDFMWGGEGCDRMYGDTSIQLRLSPDVMFGGRDDDFMDGGVNPDFLFGNDGHDTIVGDIGDSWMFASVDMMFGQDGCDTMSGGRAVDFMWGGPGVDQMKGEWGPDVMFGQGNGDVMSGGELLDVIAGNAGNDQIHGDDFADVIIGGDGDDCVDGDDGRDAIYGDGVLDLLFGIGGNDCIRGGGRPDWLFGGGGEDRIFGDAGADTVWGLAGDDQLDGGSGADWLIGGGGSDEVWGGPGWDLLFGENRHQTTSSGLDCSCNPESCSGRLCVQKFNDRNGDGVRDPRTESGLANWEFQVTCGCSTTTIRTDENGDACGSFLSGTCSVTEVLQSGWTPTTATTQNAQVIGGQTTGVSFGNVGPTDGELCIRKFEDRNGNGVEDDGESGLAEWEFLVMPIQGNFVVTTDASGNVCVRLLPGRYTIRELLRDGWVLTTPLMHTVTIAPGDKIQLTFGNRRR